MTATALTLIRTARGFIDKPSKWCKDYLHQEPRHGKHQYCIIGALNMAAHDRWSHGGGVSPAVNALVKELPGDFADAAPAQACVNFNNHRKTSHKQLMAWIDRTIKRLSRKKRRAE